jgi:glutamate-1-semialdehyde aminotransferase
MALAKLLLIKPKGSPMTNYEIIQMARQAGLPEAWISDTGVLKWSDLEAFAKLVAAKEREACAMIAETPVSGEQDDITMEAKDRVAKAIRARP